MVEILKSKNFEKMEAKYLKKLTPKQEDQYFDKVDEFKESIEPSHTRLKTHPLKGKLS